MDRNITFDQLIQYAANGAKEKFEKDGEVPPMWFALTAAGVIAIPVEYSGADSKARVCMLMQALFHKLRASAYIHVSEAWMVSGNKNNPEDEKFLKGYDDRLGDSLEHHPRRREVILIHGETKGRSVMGYFHITRPDKGPPILSPLEMDHKYGLTEGRMVGLLPELVNN